jgi:glycosyltransferase involved in cell wall biosynthesis
MGAPLRIGINALYLIPGHVGGTEIYLRSLLRGLAEVDDRNSYVVYTNKETGRDLVPNRANFEWSPQSVPAKIRPARILWEQFVLPFELINDRIDVLFNPGFTSPLFTPCESVTVFHDLQHKRHPEYFRWFDLPFWRFFLYFSAMRSSSLIAVSEATRDDLLFFYRLRPSKVRTVTHGVDERMFEIGTARRQNAAQRCILCVSTLHPHKNVDRLLHAFCAFRSEHPNYRLALVGAKGFHSEAIERLIEELGLADSVEVTGWIDREDLYRIYGQAYAFVYPSTFEGFGMPILEAMAAGIPTACSAIEPLKTISGDGALHFDPASADDIRKALDWLACDDELRARLSEIGPRRAAQFRWRKAAEATLSVLREVVRG